LTISSSTLEVFYGILVWEYWFSFSLYNMFLVCAFLFFILVIIFAIKIWLVLYWSWFTNIAHWLGSLLSSRFIEGWVQIFV
jgi:hypothetical protein